MPNGDNDKIKKLYNGLAEKNPQLKEKGYDVFYQSIQDDKNLQKVYNGLAMKNPSVQEIGFEGFKQTLFPDGVKKKEETAGSAGGSENYVASEDIVPSNASLDVLKMNVSLEDQLPKEGLLPSEDNNLTPDDKKLIEDYKSLYDSDPREFEMSKDEIIQDLHLHHVDYEPPSNLPPMRLATMEEVEQWRKDNPEEAEKQAKEYADQLAGYKRTNTQLKLDKIYQDKVAEEKLSDAQLILQPDYKADDWIDDAWESQSQDVRATDQLFKFKSNALHREVDKHSSFEADIEKATQQYGGLEALQQNPQLKDQIKTQVLNERLGYGIKHLSPEHRNLYNLQNKYLDLKFKNTQQLSPGDRSKLVEEMQQLEGQIKELRDGFPALYDPVTGEYIDPNDASDEQLERAKEYEKKVQKELVKYKNSDLGKLIRSWNQLQSNHRYFDEVLKNKPLIPRSLMKGAPLLSIKQVNELPEEYMDTGTAFIGLGKPGESLRMKHRELTADAKAKFDAVNRALLLNQDPSVVDKGFWSLFGEHALEGFVGNVIDSDADFIENFVRGIEETGGVLTQAQKDAAKDEIMDKVAKGMGDSIRPILELAITSVATAGMGSIPAVARTGMLVRGAMVSRWGRAGKFGYNMLRGQLQGAVSFGLTSDENLSAIMGAGEGTVQGIIDAMNPAKWMKSSKYAKLLELGTRTFAGTIGETGAEFVGDYLDNLSDANYNWEFAFEKTFGRTPEDFEDKLVTTAIMSAMFSGTHNTMTMKWAREQIANSDSPHKKEYLETIDQMASKREADKEVAKDQEPPKTQATTEEQQQESTINQSKSTQNEEQLSETEQEEGQQLQEVEPQTTEEEQQQPQEEQQREPEEVLDEEQEAAPQDESELLEKMKPVEREYNLSDIDIDPENELIEKETARPVMSIGDFDVIEAELTKKQKKHFGAEKMYRVVDSKKPQTLHSWGKIQNALNTAQTYNKERAAETETTAPVFTSQDGNYTVEKSDKGIVITNQKTGKPIDRRSSNYNKVVDEYKTQNIEELKKGKEIEAEPGMTMRDFYDKVASESENPREIAEGYLNELSQDITDDDLSKEGIIAHELGKFPMTSIDRFGDRNQLQGQKQILLNYVSKSGRGIDVQAMEMSEQYGIDITPNDIIEFVQSHPSGSGTYREFQIF